MDAAAAVGGRTLHGYPGDMMFVVWTCRRKTWLQTEGSPKSVIERAEFAEEHEIKAYTFKTFDVRK